MSLSKLFNPGQLNSTNKADATSTAARKIQDQETRDREKKTARLRAAREALYGKRRREG